MLLETLERNASKVRGSPCMEVAMRALLRLLKKHCLLEHVLGLAEIPQANPTSRKRCFGAKATRSRNDKAMRANSSQEDRGEVGVWLARENVQSC